MNHKIKFLILTLLMGLTFSSCGTTSYVPLTGRKQSLMVDDQQILGLSTQQYTDLIKQSKLSTNTKNTALVKQVGQKLASAVENYLKNNGAGASLQYFQWEFNLIADKQVNAFCMPGGKIAVYEGLLPVTQDEASLAIVLGHEIAHAVARHSAEQMSTKLRQQYGSQILGGVLEKVVGKNTSDLAAAVASTGFSFANLKYSRDNEYEADYMGLIFAAMAGYNPELAIPFWQRMSANSAAKTSEFLSDHPSDANRIAKLQAALPEALKYYKK